MVGPLLPALGRQKIGRSLHLMPARCTQWVLGQLDLHNEILSQTKSQKQPQQHCIKRSGLLHWVKEQILTGELKKWCGKLDRKLENVYKEHCLQSTDPEGNEHETGPYICCMAG